MEQNTEQTMIERSKVLEACRVLGFDPNDVFEMTLTPQVVRVTTFTRNDEGARVRESGGFLKDTREYPITTENGAGND